MLIGAYIIGLVIVGILKVILFTLTVLMAAFAELLRFTFGYERPKKDVDLSEYMW